MSVAVEVSDGPITALVLRRTSRVVAPRPLQGKVRPVGAGEDKWERLEEEARWHDLRMCVAVRGQGSARTTEC